MNDEARPHFPPRPFSDSRSRRSRGYLPHDRRVGGTQFVTFRMAPGFLAQTGGIAAFPDALDEVAQRIVALHPRRSRLLTWVVMPDHVHFVAHAELDPAHALVQYVKKSTAIALRRRFGGRGPVWMREFFDVRVEDGAVLDSVAYVEANPVRAGLCSDALAWKWSGIHDRLRPWLAGAASKRPEAPT